MPSVSRHTALQSYQRTAEAYVPKQKIQREESGETNVSFYEHLTQSISDSIRSTSENQENGTETLVNAHSYEIPTRTISPEMEQALEARKSRLTPLVTQYIATLGHDPTTSDGRAQFDSTMNFYSRSEKLATRFESLVQTLVPAT